MVSHHNTMDMTTVPSRRSVICHTNDYSASFKMIENHEKEQQRRNSFLLPAQLQNTTYTQNRQKYREVLYADNEVCYDQTDRTVYQKNENKDSGFEDVYEDEETAASAITIREGLSPTFKTILSAFASSGVKSSAAHRSPNDNMMNLPVADDECRKSSYFAMPTLVPSPALNLLSSKSQKVSERQPQASTLTTLPNVVPNSSTEQQREQRHQQLSARQRKRLAFKERYASLLGPKHSAQPENIPSLDNVNLEHNLKRRFEGSVLSALKDPKVRYLLTLYDFVDEGLLKNTLLKFLKSSCLDEETLKEASKYLDRTTPPSKSSKENYFTNLATELTSSKQRLDDSDCNSSMEIDVGNYDFPGTSKNSTETLAPSSPSTPATERRFLFDEGNANTIDNKLHPATNLSPNESDGNVFVKCEYCQKNFYSEYALQRHLRTHEGKRTHKCAHCSRSFYDQSSYVRHMRSHNGDKKHKCDECSMAFNKRSALEVHMRTHTGERPFVCEFCGKGFSISGNLHRHVLIHTGDRPYKCGKCPRAFNNPSHLARHISSFHTT